MWRIFRQPQATTLSNQRCAAAGVQESIPAGVGVFQQEPEQNHEWSSGYFRLEQGPEQEQE